MNQPDSNIILPANQASVAGGFPPPAGGTSAALEAHTALFANPARDLKLVRVRKIDPLSGEVSEHVRYMDVRRASQGLVYSSISLKAFFRVEIYTNMVRVKTDLATVRKLTYSRPKERAKTLLPFNPLVSTGEPLEYYELANHSQRDKSPKLFDADNLFKPQHCLDLPPHVATKRGKIAKFSKKSRSRLIQKINSSDCIKQGGHFMTLTYGDYPTDFQVYKRHMNNFLCRLRYMVKKEFAIDLRYLWKLEFQKRGAPHYHLMIFGILEPYLAFLQAWVSFIWFQVSQQAEVLRSLLAEVPGEYPLLEQLLDTPADFCFETGVFQDFAAKWEQFINLSLQIAAIRGTLPEEIDIAIRPYIVGTNVRYMQDASMVAAYVGKYLSKLENEDPELATLYSGRFWGMSRNWEFPVVVLWFKEHQFKKFRRCLSNVLENKGAKHYAKRIRTLYSFWIAGFGDGTPFIYRALANIDLC